MAFPSSPIRSVRGTLYKKPMNRDNMPAAASMAACFTNEVLLWVGIRSSAFAVLYVLLIYTNTFHRDYPFIFALFRIRASNMPFRIRRLKGVTSKSSSSAMNPRLCSMVRITGGTSFSASSDPAARMFVSWFSFAYVHFYVFGLGVFSHESSRRIPLCRGQRKGFPVPGRYKDRRPPLPRPRRQ